MTKKRPPEGSQTTENNSTCSSAQRQRLLLALRENAAGLTTIELRERYDIMAPAPRIHELRWHYGHNIQTVDVRDTNAQGNRHRCGRYVLCAGKWHQRTGGAT